MKICVNFSTSFYKYLETEKLMSVTLMLKMVLW